jgi:hypothetical protein
MPWTSSGFCVGSAIQLLNVTGHGELGRMTDEIGVRPVPFIRRLHPWPFRFTIVASIPSGCGS